MSQRETQRMRIDHNLAYCLEHLKAQIAVLISLDLRNDSDAICITR